ncbi:MAG: DUF1292 domain-containing protein [Clostridia bacterium]|nr:DUF1292 domain-containing protein [Clostridia bacterium]
MENENCEIFDDDELITLYDDKGNPIKFVEVACVEHEGNFYVLLSPAEEVEGIGEDEVIICKLEEQDDETQLIVPVESEELMNAVFEEYLRTAHEHCDCGCEDCDGECDGECDGDCDCEGDHCDCGCHKE